MMIMSEENMPAGNAEHLVSLGEKLRQAADEIDNVKNSFAKNTEDLSRIKSMLDVGSLEDINNLIERFEGEITEAERRKEEAFQGAKKYSTELEKEKERLIKLWDAYKNQEEELSKAEREIKEFEEQTNNAEASKKQLEDDFNVRIDTLTQKLKESEEKINQFDEYEKRVAEFTSIRNQLDRENHALKDDVNNKENTINSLQEQVGKLKDNEEYKDKFNDLSDQYEKEKERLTKLYKLYEETEGECNMLRGETKGWQNWFDSNKEIFNKLFSTSPPTKTSNTEGTYTTPPSSSVEDIPKNIVEGVTKENENEKTKPKSKKRKLRFVK